MIRRTPFGFLMALCVAIGLSVTFVAPAGAANCQCYYPEDCPPPPEGKEAYCNYQATCTRHCELQVDWQAGWGTPPTAQADCDNYIGACHDNVQTDPTNPDDGDRQNCEPPTAAIPGGGTAKFKVRDGNCATKDKPKPADDAVNEINGHTQVLFDLANAGGGPVILGGDPYMVDVMINVAQYALGIYDLESRTTEDGDPTMKDVRNTCGPEAIQVLGNALAAEVQAVADQIAAGLTPPSTPLAAMDGLSELSVECQAWLQRRPQNCQYPHPPEHEHPFPYVDGLDCIASNMAAMARSMDLQPVEASEPPQNVQQ